MDIADFVEDAGFHAIEAASADEALKIIEDRPQINVTFTDVNMPGSMDGIELSRVISRRWPAIGLIITSGLARPQRHELDPGALFYAKPYNLAQVLAAIRLLASG